MVDGAEGLRVDDYENIPTKLRDVLSYAPEIIIPFVNIDGVNKEAASASGPLYLKY